MSGKALVRRSHFCVLHLGKLSLLRNIFSKSSCSVLLILRLILLTNSDRVNISNDIIYYNNI